MEVHRYGARALLVDLPADTHDPAAFALAARSHFGDALVQAVPAEYSVLLAFRTSVAATVAQEQLADLDADPDTAQSPDLVEIPVTYDGPDLDTAARALAMTPAELIAVHTQTTFHVAFFGFAPGFAYLRGLPPRLHLPRRTTPRTRVPAGAVAIAARYSAVYPQASPGGWHLIGHTDVVLFDPKRDAPSLLHPGCQVRFHDR